MTPAEHHAIVAGAFSARVDGVSDWEAPAPVTGWTARDVVDHLVTWLPGFLAGGGVTLEVARPPIREDTAAGDPVAAWHAHADAVQALLEGPDADREFSHRHAGTNPLGVAIDRFYTSDVFMHTWDLARASGQDDRLDPEFSAQLLAGMEPLDEMLRASGQYGPRVEVPADAPVQDRLMAFVGRDPAWRP